MELTDSQLITAYLQGDDDAFGALYERYVRRIFDFVYYKCHHRETAEDLTSQTFMKAFERLKEFDPRKGTFSAWIHRIARNCTIDHYRRTRPETPIDDVWDLAAEDDVVRDADTALRIREVRELLRTLKPDQREIVLLRLWHGYSFGQIAQTLGKSEAACKVAFGRTLALLRDALPVFLLCFLHLLS